ncbi:hypothetical protein BVH42_04145 [Campylobacter lari]|uniref:Uncharacterized protein n=1 Tax=Campylobacter lari TaxID=201 RepID=A0A698FRU6_CAMLA|nr:hypothetical protein [Campylobacter lari]EAJ6142276.1 hypothetical protein [Campylobacter lari]EAK9857598.1 hypothetical protein [Campylobacter lari]EAL0271341.1 hypothetical protein [Campylobacter lari]ECW8954148.1 hypothetical protein [Campylobacter lari]EGG0461944.1 hypothetical protein [Campylobacter lari]
MEIFKLMIEILDQCTIVFSFITMLIVVLSFKQKLKENNEITIILQTNSQSKTLPVKILRRNFTRAELLGYLGIYNNSTQNFNIAYLTEPQFMQDVLNIQKGKANSITIFIREDDKHALL